MAIEGGKFKRNNEKSNLSEHPTVEKKSTQQLEGSSKKIVFDDDGEQRVVPIEYTSQTAEGTSGKRNKRSGKRKRETIAGNLSFDGEGEDEDSEEDEDDDQMAGRWYERYQGYNSIGELEDMKDAEMSELRRLCRDAFEVECRANKKKDPADAKWLLSALEKGTMRDRASAGALLVQTNPFCHLSALETLVGMVKLSNKGSLDVIEVLTELMLKSLMPQYRKLITIPMRGSDWKHLKQQTLEKADRDAIYAHWHYEDQLREHYFTFITNLSTMLHAGQEANKRKTIVFAARLFTNIPEMERLLLTALINKLGDPSRTVAIQALHHLQKITQEHSAMAYIVTCETEKLLFRNNVAASAQHYALGFLASIGSFADLATCQKMINICFAYFKILTEKGEINSRMMQSILTCLRRAIKSVKNDVDIAQLVEPGLLNVIYRMVHLADISIGCQGLSLLLEITEHQGREQNRFYNALYRKMLDPQLASIGPRISSVFFHIIHRAMEFDPIPERAQAFIKRLLQVAFYFSPARVCGTLIVISKVLRKRKTLLRDGRNPSDDVPKPIVEEQTTEEPEVITGGTDDEEVDEKKLTVPTRPERTPKAYDAFGRAAEYSGAQYSLKYELSRYLNYFHPTVQNFAKSILSNAPLTYYGDPLRDFSLARFLDRFAFKNPKKPRTDTDENGQERPRPKILGVIQRKGDYTPSGFRALPVNSLTKEQCAEDDEYIFNFLEKKRFRIQRAQERKKAMNNGEEEDDVGSDVDSLNDDEFDAYLDQLGVPGANDTDADVDADDVDFMQELEQEMSKGRKGKRVAKDADAEEDDALDDWDDVGEEDDDGAEEDSDDDRPRAGRVRIDKDPMDDGEFSDGGSISLEEDEDFDGDEMDDGDASDDVDDATDDEDGEPTPKKHKNTGGVRMVSERDFARKLKSSDMNSLFAAADDFSELLESNVDPLMSEGTGRKKGGSAKKAMKQQFASHGTDTEVFNQDRSSVKQLAWEANRFSDQHSKRGAGGMRSRSFVGREGAGGSRGMRGGGRERRWKKIWSTRKINGPEIEYISNKR